MATSNDALPASMGGLIKNKKLDSSLLSANGDSGTIEIHLDVDVQVSRKMMESVADSSVN